MNEKDLPAERKGKIERVQKNFAVGENTNELGDSEIEKNIRVLTDEFKRKMDVIGDLYGVHLRARILFEITPKE